MKKPKPKQQRKSKRPTQTEIGTALIMEFYDAADRLGASPETFISASLHTAIGVCAGVRFRGLDPVVMAERFGGIHGRQVTVRLINIILAALEETAMAEQVH